MAWNKGRIKAIHPKLSKKDALTLEYTIECICFSLGLSIHMKKKWQISQLSFKQLFSADSTMYRFIFFCPWKHENPILKSSKLLFLLVSFSTALNRLICPHCKYINCNYTFYMCPTFHCNLTVLFTFNYCSKYSGINVKLIYSFFTVSFWSTWGPYV